MANLASSPAPISPCLTLRGMLGYCEKSRDLVLCRNLKYKTHSNRYIGKLEILQRLGFIQGMYEM